MLKLKFREKITLAIFLTALAICVFYTSLNVTREQSAMETKIIKEKMILSDFLATTFEVAEAKAGIAYKYNLIENLGKHEDIVYVRIVKPSGEIYLSTAREEMGKFVQDSGISHTNKSIVLDDIHNKEDIKVAISTSESGYTFWIGFSLKELKHASYHTILLNILVFLPIIVIVVFISLFLSNGIASPLKELTKGARAISKGNLSYEVKVKSEDEIGMLAKTFDNMRLGLKDRNDLLNSLLRTFKGKFGNIATILVRKNVQELVRKNPRIEKILPRSLGESVKKAKKLQRERETQEKKQKVG